MWLSSSHQDHLKLAIFMRSAGKLSILGPGYSRDHRYHLPHTLSTTTAIPHASLPTLSQPFAVYRNTSIYLPTIEWSRRSVPITCWLDLLRLHSVLQGLLTDKWYSLSAEIAHSYSS